MSGTDWPARFTHLRGVEVVAHPGLGHLIELNGAWGSARVSPYGAQILSWCPRNQANVLWLSPTARMDGCGALRGGIPVCWPWFGAHPTRSGAPSHGLARICRWTVESIASGSDAASLHLNLSAASVARSHPQEPDLGLSAKLRIDFGAELSVSLTTRNRSTVSVELSQALHTYLAVSDIANVSVDGLQGKIYIDTIAGNARHRQEPDRLLFDREVDRIYLQTAEATLVDPDAQRLIRIGSAGTSSSLVAWSPWIDKVRRLDDMPDEAYRNFVCLETANAADDALQLAPGGSSTLTAVIAVASL